MPDPPHEDLKTPLIVLGIIVTCFFLGLAFLALSAFVG